MKVEYLFSKNKKVGSRIISWAASYEKLGLEELPSHCAVLLDNTWVIESTFFSGVRVAPYDKWKEINIELYRVPCDQKFRDSKDVLAKATAVWHKGYDWPGILFFTYCYIKLILFGSKLPKENKWQKRWLYFCTEYMGSLTGLDLSMASPARAYKIIIGEM